MSIQIRPLILAGLLLLSFSAQARAEDPQQGLRHAAATDVVELAARALAEIRQAQRAVLRELPPAPDAMPVEDGPSGTLARADRS